MEDAFNLNSPIAGSIKDAQVRGNPILLRSVLGYSAASRAAGGRNAFMDATKFLVSNMLRSLAKKLEIAMLYGQMGYAQISAVTGATLTIKTSEWAPGIWIGAENMPIEIRSNDNTTSRGTAVVKQVDMETREITLNAAVPGIVVTPGIEDNIFHGGAYGKEFPGIHKILSIQTGTLFNINVNDYNLFKGNRYDAGSAALSFTKVNKAVAKSVAKGLEGKIVCLVSNTGWADLLTDQAALRREDSSYSPNEAKRGSKSIMFYSQNGDIEIIPSTYVKEGYSYLLSMDDWYRVGSTDMTFKLPGQGEEFFRHLENSAGYELRLYSDQAIFCCAPGKNTLIYGIVNAA